MEGILRSVNTAIIYKPAFQRCMFGLFYFNPTVYFDLSRLSSGGSYEVYTSGLTYENLLFF